MTTFDEWWKVAQREGLWVGDYSTDAESNALLGWNAAIQHLKSTYQEAVPTREDLRKHFQDWWELYNANKLDGDEFTTLVATMLQFEPTPQKREW